MGRAPAAGDAGSDGMDDGIDFAVSILAESMLCIARVLTTWALENDSRTGAGRGSWVLSRGSWVVGRGSWVVKSIPRHD